MSEERLRNLLQEGLVDHKDAQEIHEDICDQVEIEEEEEEKLKVHKWEEFEKLGSTYLSDRAVLQQLTSMDLLTFTAFVAECSKALEMTTW